MIRQNALSKVTTKNTQLHVLGCKTGCLLFNTLIMSIIFCGESGSCLFYSGYFEILFEYSETLLTISYFLNFIFTFSKFAKVSTS